MRLQRVLRRFKSDAVDGAFILGLEVRQARSGLPAILSALMARSEPKLFQHGPHPSKR
jgi:hypothetical protein